MLVTYYVGADRTEGVGPAHIKMSGIEPQENFDVIEAVSLNGNKWRFINTVNSFNFGIKCL